jgi:hypothetical protein
MAPRPGRGISKTPKASLRIGLSVYKSSISRSSIAEDGSMATQMQCPIYSKCDPINQTISSPPPSLPFQFHASANTVPPIYLSQSDNVSQQLMGTATSDVSQWSASQAQHRHLSSRTKKKLIFVWVIKNRQMIHPRMRTIILGTIFCLRLVKDGHVSSTYHSEQVWVSECRSVKYRPHSTSLFTLCYLTDLPLTADKVYWSVRSAIMSWIRRDVLTCYHRAAKQQRKQRQQVVQSLLFSSSS